MNGWFLGKVYCVVSRNGNGSGILFFTCIWIPRMVFEKLTKNSFEIPENSFGIPENSFGKRDLDKGDTL